MRRKQSKYKGALCTRATPYSPQAKFPLTSSLRNLFMSSKHTIATRKHRKVLLHSCKNLSDANLVKGPQQRKIRHIRRHKLPHIILKHPFELERLAPLMIHLLALPLHVPEIAAVFIPHNHISVVVKRRRQKSQKRKNRRNGHMPVQSSFDFSKKFFIQIAFHSDRFRSHHFRHILHDFRRSSRLHQKSVKIFFRRFQKFPGHNRIFSPADSQKRSVFSNESHRIRRHFFTGKLREFSLIEPVPIRKLPKPLSINRRPKFRLFGCQRVRHFHFRRTKQFVVADPQNQMHILQHFFQKPLGHSFHVHFFRQMNVFHKLHVRFSFKSHRVRKTRMPLLRVKGIALEDETAWRSFHC